MAQLYGLIEGQVETIVLFSSLLSHVVIFSHPELSTSVNRDNKDDCENKTYRRRTLTISLCLLSN